MNYVEKSVREFCNKIITTEQLREESSITIAFSYITGRSLASCRGMNLEPEMTSEQEDEYYEVEGYVNKIKSEINMEN